VRGEEAVGGVEAAGRDSGLGEHRRERASARHTDVAVSGEDGLGGEDRGEREGRPVAGRERPIEDGSVGGEIREHRGISIVVVGTDRVRPERIDRDEEDV